MMRSQMSYKRVGSRRGYGIGSKGFRLNSRRFSVQGLRARFFYLFRLFSGWRSSYGRALRLMMKKLGININGYSSIKRNNSGGSGSSSSRSFATPKEVRAPFPNSSGTGLMRSSLGRSNSFYSEAIADCLEFIKRSSISVDQKQPLPVCQ